MGDLADSVPPPPESGVSLIADPRESLSLDEIIRLTIRARKLQRLVTGWRDEVEFAGLESAK
jgi:hypothetical protein